MPRRRRATLPSNELVPIAGERLRWALAAKGISNREAGRRLAQRLYGAGESPKDAKSVAVRVDNILGGQKRCERILRRELARLTELPVKWLSGEEELLPYAYYTRGIDGSDAGPLPNRRQLATHHFNSKLAAALKREKDQGDLRAASGISMCLSRLIDPTAWRAQLIRHSPRRTTQDIIEATPVISRDEWRESEEESEAREALVRAFLYILRPWQEGCLELNGDFLIAVAFGPAALVEAQVRERGASPAPPESRQAPGN